MIYLIRHTSVAVPKNTCYGQSDVALADTFPKEVLLLKEKLYAVDTHATCYCSPLSRCIDLARELDFPDPVVDARLMEMDFGRWELKTWKEIGSEDLTAWLKDFVNTPAPGGESYRELVNRSIDFWHDNVSREDPSCLVIAHSGVIHALVAHVLHVPLEKSFSFHIDYGGVTAVKMERNRYVIEYMNR